MLIFTKEAIFDLLRSCHFALDYSCLLILYWMMMSSKCLSSENNIQKFLDRFMILSEAVKKVYQLKLLESDNVESLQEEDVTHYFQNMHLLASNFV